MIRISSKSARFARRAATVAALLLASGAGVFLAPALVSAQPQRLAQVQTASVAVEADAAQGQGQGTVAAAPRKVRVIKLFDVPPEQLDAGRQ